MAPQSLWWHDAVIVAVARAVLLNIVAIVGLLAAESFAAHVIDGHTPLWGLVGDISFAAGLVVTEVAAATVLLRAPEVD